MKLNMDTPIANAPIVCAESPQWPAMAVEKMPISGTVILEMMFGIAMRKISLFILFIGDKNTKNIIFRCIFGAEFGSVLRKIEYLCRRKNKHI